MSTDLAYLAGLIDGEGYVGIKRTQPSKRSGRVNPGYHERIQVRMVDEPAIRFLAETLGGWYYSEQPHCNNGRPLFCYQANDLAAAKICEALLPYLRVKTDQAGIVLALRCHKDSLPDDHRVVVPTLRRNRWGNETSFQTWRISPAGVAYRESLWQAAHVLNGGARD